MADAGKLRKKTPQHPHPGGRIRRALLEAMFFVALAIFGFSLVATLGGDRQPITVAAPDLPAVEGLEPGGALGLFEAASQRPGAIPTLSPIFTPSVQYWKDELIEWAGEQGVDPNLAATVMQIESCGNPVARSGAGAMGLFQVMPFHFQANEDPYDPDTNAFRGIDYLSGGLEASGRHAGLALAGYNGGHSVIYRNYNEWHYETQRYYRWGSGIYREASAGWVSSPTLEGWLNAGGQSLCIAAEDYLGLVDRSGARSESH